MRFGPFAGVLAAIACQAATLTLAPRTDETPLVGSVVELLAAVDGAASGFVYRFRVQEPGSGDFRTVQDYSPDNTYLWVPRSNEGPYQIEVTAKHPAARSEPLQTTISRSVLPRLSGGDPVISATRNALVFLYSAPPCAVGSRIRVLMTGRDDTRQFTPYRACGNGTTVNFYLAGMRAGAQYAIRQQVQTEGKVNDGPALTFDVPQPTLPLAKVLLLQRTPGRIREGVLLQSTVFGHPVATDINGDVLWYYAGPVNYLTRPEVGGLFYVLIEKHDGGPYDQLLTQIDLAGEVVLKTNAGAINDQLQARGMHPITSFHHEARALPGGKTLVLAATERMLTDVQGPGAVDVIGDMILVLDRNLQVEWAWDAFDHLDVTRGAVLDEKCMPGSGGCPTFYLASQANDWLHGNSLELTPDGNILYSARHQDWVIKIHYANGQGSGSVIWRLGKDGDFRMVSDDPHPWFSHQHDPNYEGGTGLSRIILFDNGNTRYYDDSNATSRGQVLDLDEEQRVATLGLNADLGAYSVALGSAQKLANGNYHFNVGWRPDGTSQAVEVDATGTPATVIQVNTQQYRSFRMRDLYTP